MGSALKMEDLVLTGELIINRKKSQLDTHPNNPKKYELTGETVKTGSGKILHRIRALKEFIVIGYRVSKGELGGYVESEKNLSQEGNCWITGNARVYGNARVSENSLVFGDVLFYGNAKISGDAEAFGNARIHGHAQISGSAEVSEGEVTK
jgi:predicted acyltransferase (DUF342 family)